MPAHHYLRTLRERRGFTQGQLATLSHVAQNTISKLERSISPRASFATAKALAQALGVSPGLLHFGPDPRHKDRPLDARRRRPDAAEVQPS
jgi:transcriptional regulator with XRE-family HTH domain